MSRLIISSGMSVDCRTITLSKEDEIIVSSGGTATNIDTGKGGYVSVVGGFVSGIAVKDHGGLYVSGGTAIDVNWNPCEGDGVVYWDSGSYVTFANVSGVYYGHGDGKLASHAMVMSSVTMSTREVYNAQEDDYDEYSDEMYVMSGGTAVNITADDDAFLDVYSGGTMVDPKLGSVWGAVHSGGKLTGKITFLNVESILNGWNPYFSVEDGAIIDFDLTRTSPGTAALVNCLAGLGASFSYGDQHYYDGDYTLSVNGNLSDGTYKLAEYASGFSNTITVTDKNSGSYLGSLTVGQTTSIGGVNYTLSLSNSTLSVTRGGTGGSPGGDSIVCGGTRVISSGQTSTGLAISSGTLIISNGGVANSTTVNSGGGLHVSSGGTANNTTVIDGSTPGADSGGLYVSAGGVANDTTVIENGWMYVSSGGIANRTTVSPWGDFYVYSGGVANRTTVDGGELYVEGGTATNIIWTPCEGYVEIYDGGYATFVSEYSGVYYGSGNKLLSNTSVMNGKTLDDDSEMNVMNGGVANSTTVNGGDLYISSGGTANNTTAYEYGYVFVSSGGIANSTTVSSYGKLSVRSGGTADNTTVNSGGWLYVSSGGTANSTTINSGGLLNVFSGGMANSTIINRRANMYVLSGGSADATRIYGTEDSRGRLFVSSGGCADNTILSGGWGSVFRGGAANNTNIYDDGRLFITGTAQNTSVFADGYLWVSNGGVVINTTISGRYALADIVDGGKAVDTIVSSGGSLWIWNGGTADGIVLNQGYLWLEGNASATNVVCNEGRIVCESGAYVVFPEKSSGVSYELYDNYFGSEFVFSRTMTRQTVSEGGIMRVMSGGTANSTTVNSNGTICFFSGGKLTGQTTIANGAIVSAYDGAVLDFDISNVSPGATARFNDFSRISAWGNANFTLTVSGSQADGTYKLAEGASDFNKTISVVNISGKTLGTLEVGERVTADRKEYTLNLNNDVLSVSVESTDQMKPAKFDVDGNGVSDVMFVWTGYNYAHGYWMNGNANDWRSTYAIHPAEWENLGCHDMNGDGKADSVLVGNIELQAGKGAYIGYYLNGEDTDANWVNIDFLNNPTDVVWKNKVCNLTGNANSNSIIWYAPDMFTLGAWTDGTSQWALLNGGFGTEWWKMAGCGDFDGDGKDSVLMSGYDCKFLYSVGLDGVAHSHGSTNWWGWEVRAIGDFAGDGKDDIVLFHGSLGAMVMLVDGNTDNYESLGQIDAKDWFVVGAGDYNGDQKDDLLVRQYSTGMLGYYSSGDTSQWIEMGRGVDLNWTVIA